MLSGWMWIFRDDAASPISWLVSPWTVTSLCKPGAPWSPGASVESEIVLHHLPQYDRNIEAVMEVLSHVDQWTFHKSGNEYALVIDVQGGRRYAAGYFLTQEEATVRTLERYMDGEGLYVPAV